MAHAPGPAAPPLRTRVAFYATLVLAGVLCWQLLARLGGRAGPPAGAHPRRATSSSARDAWGGPVGSGWGFGLGSYLRDAGVDVQYRRVVARLERLASAVGERNALAARREQSEGARAFGGDSEHDALSVAQLAAEEGDRLASIARAAAALAEDAALDGGAALPPLVPFAPHALGARWFITYGDARYNRSKARITAEAARFGVFDAIRAWGPEDLSLEFVRRNYATLSQPRGGGYWLWKPFVIAQTLADMQDGDVLMYADAGCTFLSDPTPYLALAGAYGMVAFRVPHSMGQYTKGLAFKVLGLDLELWAPEQQVIAGILVLQKRPFTTFLVAEWLRLAQDAQLLTDVDTSGLAPNHASFVDHRHDQSLWSLLVHKYGAQLVLSQRHFPPEAARIIAATRREG